jgi:hypothetical protein
MSVLDAAALVVILLLITAVAAAIVVLGSITGQIARKRSHPYSGLHVGQCTVKLNWLEG